MAVKQRESRIVSQEIDFDRFAAGNDDYIFEDPSRGGSRKPRQLEGMTMQMHGVIVIALIVKVKAVPGVRSQQEGSGFRIFFAIDGPMVHPVVAGKFPAEYQGEGLGRLGLLSNR